MAYQPQIAQLKAARTNLHGAFRIHGFSSDTLIKVLAKEQQRDTVAENSMANHSNQYRFRMAPV